MFMTMQLAQAWDYFARYIIYEESSDFLCGIGFEISPIDLSQLFLSHVISKDL